MQLIDRFVWGLAGLLFVNEVGAGDTPRLISSDSELVDMEERVRSLKSQEAELIASIQLYQSYLVGLVAVCSFINVKVSSD